MRGEEIHRLAQKINGESNGRKNKGSDITLIRHAFGPRKILKQSSGGIGLSSCRNYGQHKANGALQNENYQPNPEYPMVFLYKFLR